MLIERVRKSVKFRLANRARKHALNHFRRYCLNLAGLVREPVFVKVGASDGITDDPCSDLLLAAQNWKGLLIEPVPYCFDKLKTNFHDTRRFSLEQVAIGEPTRVDNFYYVDPNATRTRPELPGWIDKLGSFDRNHIIKHLNGVLEPFITECKVEVRPLSDVLTTHGIQDIHLLQIDAEGYDFEVLKTLDFAKHVPFCIFIEHKHLADEIKKEMQDLLDERGYSVQDCGEDYFAVNVEANSRLESAPSIRR